MFKICLVRYAHYYYTILLFKDIFGVMLSYKYIYCWDGAGLRGGGGSS